MQHARFYEAAIITWSSFATFRSRSAADTSRSYDKKKQRTAMDGTTCFSLKFKGRR